MEAFFRTLHENLQKVSTEIFSKVKEFPFLYEQSVKMKLIEKFFGHAHKKCSNPCQQAFILSLQLGRMFKMEAVPSLWKMDQTELL